MKTAMMIRTLVATGVILTTAACSSDGGTGAQPQSAHFRKVSGDNQRALVKGFARSRDATRWPSAVAAPEDSLFSDPLVGVLTAVVAQARGPASSRLRATSLPSNTVIQWEASDPLCARPRLTVTLPGAGDTIVNRAVRGTRAGACRIRTVTLIGSQVVEADSFMFTIDPGPAAAAYDTGDQPYQSDSLVLTATAVQDGYGNAVPFVVSVPEGVTLAVSGTEPGTLAARTLRFTGILRGEGWRYVVPLMANGVQVGKLLVVAVSDGRLAWRATGVGIGLN